MCMGIQPPPGVFGVSVEFHPVKRRQTADPFSRLAAKSEPQGMYIPYQARLPAASRRYY